MLHRELKINFGELERVTDALECYRDHLEKLEQCVRRIWNSMNGMEGEAGEALLFSRKRLLGSLRTEMTAVQETCHLLRKYISEMTAIIQPDLYGNEMVVDRNDIFANLVTMAERSERLMNLNPYTIIWSGDVYTRFPDAQTRKREETYYRKVHDLLENTAPAYGRHIVANVGYMLLLYNDKIKPYENMDDEYTSLARALYLKYVGETTRTNRNNELRFQAETDVLTGIWDALIDLVTGPFILAGEAADTGRACMYYCLYDQMGWEKPDWMTECVEAFVQGAQAIGNDPFILVESMAQEISDTYEEKGIFYCGGYIGGSILGTKGIDKAFKSARMMSGAGKLYRRMSKLDDVDDLIPRLKSLEDILSPDDIAAYKKFLQNESRAGLTQEELQAIQRVNDYLALDQADFDDLLRMKGKWGESGRTSPKGLIGRDFEDYLTKNIGGDGSFSVGGRDFDGGIGNRWWEAKSGQYWDMLESNPNKLAKFKSDMGDRLRIATANGATYELFSNTPIPASIKQWLDKKGIAYTELLD